MIYLFRGLTLSPSISLLLILLCGVLGQGGGGINGTGVGRLYSWDASQLLLWGLLENPSCLHSCINHLVAVIVWTFQLLWKK